MFNVTVRVKEWQGDVVFLHEVLPGSADRSYGIQVAKLAGLPAAVIARRNRCWPSWRRRMWPDARALADTCRCSRCRRAPPRTGAAERAERLVEAVERCIGRNVAARRAGGAVRAEGKIAEAVANAPGVYAVHHSRDSSSRGRQRQAEPIAEPNRSAAECSTAIATPSPIRPSRCCDHRAVGGRRSAGAESASCCEHHRKQRDHAADIGADQPTA